MSNKILFILIFPILSGCFSIDDNNHVEKKELGNLRINYYSNKSVNSLDIPPDLTRPEHQKSFRISEYVKGVDENFINFSGKENIQPEKILEVNNEIKVRKNNSRRWLEISKTPDQAWNLVREFFKLEGFAIKKSNKKIGIIETDYLENRPELPDQSLGLIRSMIQSVTSQSYSFPVIDKYRIRIEPLDNHKKSEIFISIHSMKEIIDPNAVVSGNTIWVEKDPDISTENEMLLRFMIFLGESKPDSIQKIINAEQNLTLKSEVVNGINGYAKLRVQSDVLTTWDALSWAFDRAGINLEDKDIKEKSFYIQAARSSDKGIMTYLFGEDAVQMSFQILLSEVSIDITEVSFNDISENNENETKKFSYDFFNNINKHLTYKN